MTQGHIYHLGARKEGLVNAFEQTGLLEEHLTSGTEAHRATNLLRGLFGKAKERHLTPIEYKHLNFSKPDTPDTMEEKRRKKVKYVAYHIGQTAYTPEEVLKLSKAVINHMHGIGLGSYDFLENNCQHFTLSLVRRIVMTQRRPIAIGGTRLELAEMDLGLPTFMLKPWFTKWKAKFLPLPLAVNNKSGKDCFQSRYFNLGLTTLTKQWDRSSNHSLWRNHGQNH
jgi:hypothetical protein